MDIKTQVLIISQVCSKPHPELCHLQNLFYLSPRLGFLLCNRLLYKQNCSTPNTLSVPKVECFNHKSLSVKRSCQAVVHAQNASFLAPTFKVFSGPNVPEERPWVTEIW